MRWTNLSTWAVAALCVAGAVTGGGLLAKVTSTLEEPMALDALVVQVPNTQPLPPRLPLPTPPVDGPASIQAAIAVHSQDPLVFQEGQNAQSTTVQVVRPAAVQITEQGPARGRVAPEFTWGQSGGWTTSGSPLAFGQVNQAMNSLNQAKLALKNAAKDEDKKRAEEQLQKSLNDYFDQDIVRRKKELVEIKKKVEEIEKQLLKRETSKGEIVDLQKKVIVNEVNGLGFFGTPAASPAGGLFSNWPLGNSTFGVQIEKTTPSGNRRVTVPAPAALPGLPPSPGAYSTPDANAPATQAGPAVYPRAAPPAPTPPAAPSAGAPSTAPAAPPPPAAPPAPIEPQSTAPTREDLSTPPQVSQSSHKVKTITTKFSFPFGRDDLAIKLWATTAS